MKTLRLSIILLMISAASAFSSSYARQQEKESAASLLKHEDPKEFATFNFGLPAPDNLPILRKIQEEQPSIAEDLLQLASSFIGTPYRRGGKTPKGFDCSGFSGYIFNQFGIKLAASSSAQYTQGEEVDKNEVMPGDLLFFNGRAVGKRIGHVGIAIEQNPVTGEITFIHSANGGGIRIDRTTSPYYARRFVGVRRVL